MDKVEGKQNRLNARSYKQWLKSKAKWVAGKDLLTLKTKKPLGSEANVSVLNHSNRDDTEGERVDFLLGRVENSDQTERSDSSDHDTQTQSKKRQKVLEDQCNLGMLEQNENSAHCVASACESTTTTFVEHWVPVRLSNIQIEQYCGSLFSNATKLCSSLKHDLSEIFLDILFSIRKCCDHPYLVDSSLHTSLVQGLPIHEKLDAEIKLSNKLLLLYKILLEIRNRGLRVLILYQLLEGSGLISTGDILDNIIHEKFGMNSFVRIWGGIARPKRREVLKKFNDKRDETFVCLMETRACVPSIELASVDSVIIFNSDLDPMNDLRALQKIKLDSQFEQVKVFRLYSSHTVEEEVLILAKQGMPPEGNLLNIKQSTYHSLLNWGTWYLFKRLEEFHSLSTDAHAIVSTEDSFVEDVLLELSELLPKNDQTNVHKSSLIKEAQQIGGFYSKNITLLGEVESPLMENFSSIKRLLNKNPPYVFWTNLLEGRKPRWKYFSSQSPRTRKSTQLVEDFFEEPAVVDTTLNNCRKEANIACQGSTSGIIKKLQSQNKLNNVSGCKAYDSAQHKVKYKSLANVTLQNQAAEPTSTGLQYLLPADKFSYMPSCTTKRNNQAHDTCGHNYLAQAAMHQCIKGSIRPSESSVQPSAREVPLQTACIASPAVENLREPSSNIEDFVSRTSLSCQPLEFAQITNFETLESVSKSLQIELERLHKRKAEVLKLHEDKKVQLKIAYEEAIAQAGIKLDMLLQNAEMAFVEEKQALETRYDKLHNNKSLIEVMMTKATLTDTTFSTVNTNSRLEKPELSTVKRPEQNGESHQNSSQPSYSAVLKLNHELASVDIVSTSNGTNTIPCVTAEQTIRSREVATPAVRPDQLFASLSESLCSLPVQQDSVTTPSQLYPKSPQQIATPYMPPGQQMIIQSLTVNPNDIGATILLPTQNIPITISRNLQTEYTVKAPAPHLRHMFPKLPVTTPTAFNPLIPDERKIFSRVNIQKGVYKTSSHHDQPQTYVETKNGIQKN